MAGRLASWVERRALDLPVLFSPSGGWRGVEDIPEALQFAAHIGRREGFMVPSNAAPRSEAEREWQRWWLDLPEQHANWEREMRVHIQLGGSPPDPPDVAPPADLPRLRALVERYQEPFRQDWTRIKLALIRLQLDSNAHPIDLNRVIRTREREVGRRTRPFAYRIDFVFWPENYVREVSECHLVLSIDYLDESRRAAYEDLVRELIRRLV